MNVFYLDQDPILAAHYHNDKHCNKMLLEYAQLFQNCFTIEQLQHAPKTKVDTFRKHTHLNHPSSLWVKETRANMKWLLRMLTELEKERIYRGFKPHFTSTFISWVRKNFRNSQVPEGRKQTALKIAISEDAECRKYIKDFEQLPPVQQYRLYYVFDKEPILHWTHRTEPEWLEMYREIKKQAKINNEHS